MGGSWGDIKMDLKTVISLLVAATTLYAAYYGIRVKVDSYETEIKGLKVEVADLKRGVIELTVELRTRGVIHAGQ